MQEHDIVTRRYNSLMILGVILPFLITPFLSIIFYEKGQSFVYTFIISRFIIWATLAAMFFYARYAEVQRFFLWEEIRYHFLFYLKWIFFLYLSILVAGMIAHIPYWLGLHEKNEMMHKMNLSMKQHPSLGIFASVTAGITEEFIFRGYIMSRLSLFFKNRFFPILVSAVLFSAIHLGYKNVGEIIFTFLFGLILGYHYQRYRNIKVLIVVHTLVDLVAILIVINHR